MWIKAEVDGDIIFQVEDPLVTRDRRLCRVDGTHIRPAPDHRFFTGSLPVGCVTGGVFLKCHRGGGRTPLLLWETLVQGSRWARHQVPYCGTLLCTVSPPGGFGSSCDVGRTLRNPAPQPAGLGRWEVAPACPWGNHPRPIMVAMVSEE